MFVCAGCVCKKSENYIITEYLNQPPPGTKPVVFAQEFLPLNSRDVAFTPDGKEFYFTQVKNDTFTILCSKYIGGKWTVPSIAPFSGIDNDFEPCISSNGKKFYFASMRPSKLKKEMKNDVDIWSMNRDESGWSKPKLVDATINTKCMEYYPSITKKGALYFGRNDSALTRGDIYSSKFIDNKYNRPEKLPEVVNFPGTSFNAFIASDESYLIFSTYLKNGLSWHSDLHISFRDSSGEWTDPQNMGEQINSTSNELSPWVSHDGKYLFFASKRLDSTGQNKKHNIFWVNAEVIENYRLNK